MNLLFGCYNYKTRGSWGCLPAEEEAAEGAGRCSQQQIVGHAAAAGKAGVDCRGGKGQQLRRNTEMEVV